MSEHIYKITAYVSIKTDSSPNHTGLILMTRTREAIEELIGSDPLDFGQVDSITFTRVDPATAKVTKDVLHL